MLCTSGGGSAVLAFACAALMNAWRGPDADYSAWQWAIERFAITDPWPFVQVAYLHRASYLGASLGLLVALVALRPARHGADPAETSRRAMDSQHP